MAILNEQFRRMQKLAGLITEEQLNEATSYLAIKDSLTSAMESMGYKQIRIEDESIATFYTTLTYEKPMGEKSMLIAEVVPDADGQIDQKSADPQGTKMDYSMIRTAMYFLHDKEEEEKKFFGLVKKKVSYISPQPVMDNKILDLSQNSTEEAVNKIVTIFKEGEAKAQGMLDPYMNEDIEQFEDMEEPSLDDVLSKEDLMNKLNNMFDNEDMSNLSFFQKIIITAVKKQIISKIKKGEIQTRAGLKAALEKGST